MKPSYNENHAIDLYERFQKTLQVHCDPHRLSSLLKTPIPQGWFGCSVDTLKEHISISDYTVGKSSSSPEPDLSFSLNSSKHLRELRVPTTIANEPGCRQWVTFGCQQDDMPYAILISPIDDDIELSFTWCTGNVGVLHRLIGPALVIWNTSYQTTVQTYYYIDGTEIHRNEFVRRYEMTHLEEYTGL